MITDTGERREFESGAVRDVANGKGRCDLLPLDVVSAGLGTTVLKYINDFVRSHGEDRDALYKAIIVFCAAERDWDMYTAMLEVSKHYEEGALKYAERNWEAGIPLHCYIDSGVRHYLKWRRGDNDESHDRAFIWNMLGALWTAEHLPECNDLPEAENEKPDM